MLSQSAPAPEPLIRRFLVLNEQEELVNIVLWDGVTPWHPGEGLRAMPEPEPDAPG